MKPMDGIDRSKEKILGLEIVGDLRAYKEGRAPGIEKIARGNLVIFRVTQAEEVLGEFDSKKRATRFARSL